MESSAYRYGNLTVKKIKKILIDTRKPFINDSIYCESNQTLSLIIPVLAEAFPKAGYIWLIRNGLDMVASAYQKQWYTGHSENHDRYDDCSQIEKDWINGRICGDLCGDMDSEKWANLSIFGKCCWYWNYVNRLIEKDLHQYCPKSFFLFRLEEMDKTFKDLIKWMGLKAAILPLAGRFNSAKRKPYHWTNWTVEERNTYERFCGDLMDRFYPSWKTRTGDWNDVTYYSNSAIMRWIKKHHKLVKKINDSFALNTLK